MSEPEQDRGVMLAITLLVLGLSAWWLVRHFGATVPVAEPVPIDAPVAPTLASLPASSPHISSPPAPPQPVPPQPVPPQPVPPQPVPPQAVEQTPAPAEPVIGSSNRDALLEVIKRTRPKTARCFETHLRKHPNAAGKLTVKINIAATGHVTLASIASTTIHDAAFESCITRTFYQLRFPVQTDGREININLPLVFSAPH